MSTGRQNEELARLALATHPKNRPVIKYDERPSGPSREERMIERLVSGGQTGVDRAALDVAIACGIPHGGWCPRGRLSEAGPIPARYQLTETDSAKYWVRTEQNVIDSDGTLILYRRERSGGTSFTERMTHKHGRPCCCLDLMLDPPPDTVKQWINGTAICTLNVAGPRESTAPGIYQQAYAFLLQVFGEDESVR